MNPLTQGQMHTLMGLATGKSLGRSHALGKPIGERNVVYRWNDLDRPIPAATVESLVTMGLAEGYELVSITAMGKRFLERQPDKKGSKG